MTLLCNLPAFPLLVVLFVFMVIRTFLEHCCCSCCFCTMCLCLWRRRVFEFRNKIGGEDGACAREQSGFSIEWVTESEGERCQRKQFSWFGCQWSSETMWLPSEKTALMISLFPPLIHCLTLPASMYSYLIEHWGFFSPATIYLTKPSVLHSVQLYQIGQTTHS